MTDRDLWPHRDLWPLRIREDSPMFCSECFRKPDEIEVYVKMGEDEGLTARQYVFQNEGTLNPHNGHFWCDECYIEIGMPLGVAP